MENTRALTVLLSFDGGVSYTFHKSINTYRANTAMPYTSAIRAIASNLPLGVDVRVRVVASNGRFHFEGFGLSKLILPETNVGSFACSAGWNSIANGRLCHDPTVRGPSTMLAAIGACTALQAHVCTHSDMQQACGVVPNPYAGAAVTGWYGDHARVEPGGNTDDEYLTFNRNTCDVNNDGPAAAGATASLHYFCCQ